MKPKVSIIVPLYNCGSYDLINRLVSNVLCQTEKSWELLLCNDGSEDNTIEICEKYARKDSRIKVFNCRHRGVSATRNTGIDNALGEWITFVDADDKLTGVFIESMLNAASRNSNTNLVCCSYVVMDYQQALINLYSDSVYEGETQICSLLQNSNFLRRCSPWARMFRSDIIRNNKLRFDTNLSHSEDRLFVYNFLIHTAVIVTTSSIGYIYGSFSATSLKHTKHPVKSLFIRQYLLTNAGVDLLKKFKINDSKSYCVSGNLLHLLYDTAENIVLTCKDHKSRVKILSKLSTLFFKNEYLSIFKQDSRFENLSSENLQYNYLLLGNYKAYINIIQKRNFILRVKQLFHKFLCLRPHSPVRDFNTYISKLN